jgi:hypothetical protein
MFGEVSEVDEVDGVDVALELVLVDGRDELFVELMVPDEPEELDDEFERLSPRRSSSRER